MVSPKYYITRARNNFVELQIVYKNMIIDDFQMKNEIEFSKKYSEFILYVNKVIINCAKAELTQMNVNFKNIENVFYYIIENYDFDNEYSNIREIKNLMNFAVVIYDIEKASKLSGLLMKSLKKLVNTL